MKFAFEMMNFVLKLMNFVLKMMNLHFRVIAGARGKAVLRLY